MGDLAEQREQQIIEEESRIARKASLASINAQISIQAIDETLNDTQSAHVKVVKIMDKLESTCIRKQKEAIEIREKEEKRRLFLGLHIDRRPKDLKRSHFDEARPL